MGNNQSIIRLGNLVLDLERRVLTDADEVVKLRPKSFEVLCYLVARPGQVVAKDELLEAVWAPTVVSDDALVQCIVDIRRALGDEASRSIQTLPKRGYRFDPLLLKSTRPRRWLALAVAAVVLVAVFIGLVSTLTTPSETEKSVVAVMPFRSLDANESYAHLGAGFTEELLFRLGSSSDLTVIARGSSMAVAAENLPVTELADKLGATHLVEGSIRVSGTDEIRINVQLIDGVQGTQAWSGVFTGAMPELMETQEDVARAVAAQLNVDLAQPPKGFQSANQIAYTLHLQSRQLLNQHNADNLDHADRLLRQAIELDPQYVPLWLGLSRLHHRRGTLGLIHLDESRRLSNQALHQAALINPNAAQAGLAWQAFSVDGDMAKGVEHLKRALALKPFGVGSMRVCAGALVYLGQLEAAIELSKKVIQQDPLCAACYNNLGYTYIAAGEYPLALDVLAQAQSLAPQMWSARWLAANVYMLTDRPDVARTLYAQVPEPEGSIGVALAEHAVSPTADTRATLLALAGQWGSRRPLLAAWAAAGVPDADEAFRWLDQPMPPNHPVPDIPTWQPYFSSLPDDPRWQDVLQRFGQSPAQLAKLNQSLDLESLDI